MTEEQQSESALDARVERMLADAGERVRDRRIEKGMSQEELADLLGVRQEAVSQLERKGPRRLTTAIKVAAALDMSPSHLCFGEHSAESLMVAMPDLAERISAEMDRLDADGDDDA